MTNVAGTGLTPAGGILVLGCFLMGFTLVLLMGLGGAYLNKNRAVRSGRTVVLTRRFGPAVFGLGAVLLVLGLVLR